MWNVCFERVIIKVLAGVLLKVNWQKKGVCRSIIIELNKNHQIDWYLQAELAYNKRFGESGSKDQKNKAKRIRFMQYRVLSFDEIT